MKLLHEELPIPTEGRLQNHEINEGFPTQMELESRIFYIELIY